MGGIDLGGVSVMVFLVCCLVGFVGVVEIVSMWVVLMLVVLQVVIVVDGYVWFSLDLFDLVVFYGCYDLQVGVGGGVVWECCVVGVFSLMLVLVDNQCVVILVLVQIGVIVIVVGIVFVYIVVVLYLLLVDVVVCLCLSQIVCVLVDGWGSCCVVLGLMVLVGVWFMLCFVGMVDVEMFWYWCNYLVICVVLCQFGEILFVVYCQWLSCLLEQGCSCFYVVVFGQLEFGVICFDFYLEGVVLIWEVLFYFVLQLYGLGLGGVLLCVGEQVLCLVLGVFLCIYVEVLLGNVGLLQLF